MFYAQRETAMVIGLNEFIHPERIVRSLTDNAASSVALAVLLNEITMPGDREWRDGRWVRYWRRNGSLPA